MVNCDAPWVIVTLSVCDSWVWFIGATAARLCHEVVPVETPTPISVIRPRTVVTGNSEEVRTVTVVVFRYGTNWLSNGWNTCHCH